MKVYILNRKVLIKASIFLFIAIVLLIAVPILISSDTAQVFSQKRLLPIYSVESKDKTASITFDCAWGAGDIPDILNTLRSEEIKATFFIVGQWAERFPDSVKMIAAEGHDLANHSYSHLRMGAIDKNRIRSEIAKCGEKLESISGSKVDLFRPPYGEYNDHVISIARELGYFTIQWNVDTISIV
ncbi:MAG: polysaccharide deacetylase family protein [Clostridia bacterium]|nr:polysaccharide deacetylase family protein [Clostridia bacterium]